MLVQKIWFAKNKINQLIGRGFNLLYLISFLQA